MASKRRIVTKRRTVRDRAGRARGGATFSCPKCKNRTRVLRTIMPEHGLVKRQRRCLSCGHTFDTNELTA